MEEKVGRAICKLKVSIDPTAASRTSLFLSGARLADLTSRLIRSSLS